MERRGILCAGAWCVDRINTVEHWPAEETLSRIFDEKRHGGCPGHNMSTALKRLEAPFPVEAMGLVGDDSDGHFLLQTCDRMGIERSHLEMRNGVVTSRVIVINVKATGKRTFFYDPGAHALQTPDDFDFSKTSARIAHLGLPGVHEILDEPWQGDESGWVSVLKKARSAGLQTNMELVSVAPERICAIVEPMLPWLDSLIINDHEAGAIAGTETVKNGIADPGACRRAAQKLMEHSSLSFVAVHYPMGGVTLARNGGVAECPSVSVPPDLVAGSNGAGDCFAAGMLLGHHENWPLEKCLKLAHAAAAASLRDETTTGAVVPWIDCLKLADTWGWRRY